MAEKSLRTRLLEKTVIDWVTGCWLWTGGKSDVGYGQLSDRSTGKKRMAKAHRVSYELTNGPIPDGLVIDHLCRVRHCINPAHMEPVTIRENTIRGTAGAVNRARMLARTHCAQGHPWTPENTKVTPRQRVCRTCKKASG